MYGYAELLGDRLPGDAVQPAAAHHRPNTHAQALPQLMSAVSQTLQNLTTPTTAAADPPSPLATLASFITGPLSPLSLYVTPGAGELLGAQSYLLPQAAANLTSAAQRVPNLPAATGGGLLGGVLGSGARVVSSAGLSGVSAGMGRAGLIGGLSVPQGWASAAPAIKTAAAMLPQSSLSSLFGNMTLSTLAGRAMVGTGGAAARSAGGGALLPSGSPPPQPTSS